MVYVETRRKELKTNYKADTPEVGKQMNLTPRGLLGVKTTVPRKDRVGL